MGSEENNLSQDHIEEQQSDNDQTTNGNSVNSNLENWDAAHEQPAQTAAESQAREEQISIVDESETVNRFNEETKRLTKEIGEQRETQKAAEAALEHLRVAHAEADGKAQVLSKKLAEAEKKMEQEIKERDEKYVELDTKLQKLHKRANQRIQEVQKEKDDLEARYKDEEAEKIEKAVKAEMQAAQHELEWARDQANEALRALDGERHQLRATNTKLKHSIEEMRGTSEAKDNAIEKLQKALFEKDQEAKREVAVALAERDKAVRELQDALLKHDKETSERNAALSDAHLLLKDATLKLKSVKRQYNSEKKSWRKNLESIEETWRLRCQTLEAQKMDQTADNLRKELYELKIKYEILQDKHDTLRNISDRMMEETEKEITKLEGENKSLRISLESRPIVGNSDIQVSVTTEKEPQRYSIEIAKWQILLMKRQQAQKVEELVRKMLALQEKIDELECENRRLHQQEAMLKAELRNVDSSQKREVRHQTLEAQKMDQTADDLKKDFDGLKIKYKILQDEYDIFREISDRMMEETEKEIARLQGENKNLRISLVSGIVVENSDRQVSVATEKEPQRYSIEIAKWQILLMKRQQAQKVEELARKILALQEKIEELEHENRLHRQQEAMLKVQGRNMERSQRESMDITYLKNVTLKLLETGTWIPAYLWWIVTRVIVWQPADHKVKK